LVPARRSARVLPIPTLWGLHAAAREHDPACMPLRLEPALFANSIVIDSCDIPADMTLAQWRANRVAMTRRSRRRRRVLALLRARRSR
jgi:hypothetical protein